MYIPKKVLFTILAIFLSFAAVQVTLATKEEFRNSAAGHDNTEPPHHFHEGNDAYNQPNSSQTPQQSSSYQPAQENKQDLREAAGDVGQVARDLARQTRDERSTSITREKIEKPSAPQVNNEHKDEQRHVAKEISRAQSAPTENINRQNLEKKSTYHAPQEKSTQPHKTNERYDNHNSERKYNKEIAYTEDVDYRTDHQSKHIPDNRSDHQPNHQASAANKIEHHEDIEHHHKIDKNAPDNNTRQPQSEAPAHVVRRPEVRTIVQHQPQSSPTIVVVKKEVEKRVHQEAPKSLPSTGPGAPVVISLIGIIAAMVGRKMFIS